ncbi:MAG: tetratricopeptide repeat protein, partial [Anaerolineales bacterium]
MKKRRLILFFTVLVLAGLSCRIDRVFNPTLPTFTPTTDPLVETIIPTLTPTSIPTPEPGARIEEGDKAYFYGDYELAIQEYSKALGAATENSVKAAAMLGLGRSYLKQEQFDAALNTLTTAIASYPESLSRGEMFFTLALVYEELEQHLEANAAYEEYLRLREGLIDSYVYERIGDNYLTLESYQQGIEAYTRAIAATVNGSDLLLNMQIGDSYFALKDYNTALVTYEDIYNRTSNDYLKAEARRKVGDIHLLQENQEEAYRAYQEVVENYPLAYDAYLSLTALLDEGVAVSNLDRGLINYFVGQNGFAIDALTRYLNDFPDEHSDSAHYYLGLAYLKLANYDQAIAAWQQIVDEHINENFWAAAFDEIAYTQDVHLDDPEAAIETYLSFVDRSPLHEKSPEYLYFAARIAERDFDLKTAARLWERIGVQFSTSELAYDGLFQAGITRFRL